MSEFTTRVIGAPNTLEHRVFIERNGAPVSAFHDVPLYADKANNIFNMIVEIPRWSNAKLEISKDEPFNPIKQDVKKGKLRFVRNCFPHHGYIWNYGALPQTWEDPTQSHPETKARGDNDPLDVCEIGEQVGYTGQIKQVKVLGVMALLDEGETDWKVIVIDVTDPLASKLNDIEDVERHLPGFIRATNEWFRIYKIPDGKPENQFAFSGEAKNKKYALDVVKETHEAWERLIKGEIPSKAEAYDIQVSNVSVQGSPYIVNNTDNIPAAAPKPAASIDPSVDKWFFISGTSNLGDYTPTRLEAQADAVNLIFGAKTQSNPENTVSLMTMAGKSPKVLVTFTSDIGKILTALHNVAIGGQVSFTTSVQIAQLALKHRQNKNQRQRIIVFVGSPVEEDEKTLVKLAKKLKKNNIAVDVINFGEEAENTTKLEAFVASVNNNDNSNLVTVPPGPHLLSDILVSSAIVAGEDGAAPAFVSSGGGSYEFGVDPNLDPELALALRISLEEERARQEAASGGAAKTEEGAKAEGGAAGAGAAGVAAAAGGAGSIEDDLLAQALASSQADSDHDMEGLTEEQEMQRAIQMSMADSGTTSQNSNTTAGGDFDEAMQDPDFMNSVLGSLSGVDTSDPRIQNVLQGFSSASTANAAEEEEAKKKKEAEDAKKKDESK
ncbi:Inorganic pyrophosphatase [Mortierella sp. NVP41]|nr:Inorganic pyrophosphatase [Mortierella sp. NVP41]